MATNTSKKTPEGRIIWNDGGKDYSEKTTTFEIDGKWYTMPTVAEDGSQYTSDQMRDYVAKYGPIDFITGEELPEFRNRDDALEYAVSRSDTRKSFDEGGLATQMDSLFGYTAEGAEQEAEKLAVDFKEPEVEEYVHPLTTVPFFDRPLGSSIRDPIVGIDDAGYAHYKTVLGDTYTIKLNPDQRRFHQKFHEDILPVVKEYIKDPKLPTKEQAVGFGKAVLEETIDIASIPGDLLTGKRSAAEITNMDILDLATLTSIGASAFNAPKDSLRMASVAGMFGRKKTPVEEYLTPVEVDLDESKLVDLIDEDAKIMKAFNPRHQSVYKLTYNDVIKEDFKPLKFDEPVGRRSILLDPKFFDTRLKARVGKDILDRYNSVMSKSKGKFRTPEETYKQRDEFIKITTDIVSDQVKEQFNRFLTEQPGLVLKLSAATKLVKKYRDLDQGIRYEDVSPAEMRIVGSKARAADALQTTTIVEILDRFFNEAIAYTPDPAGVFKDREFTFKVTDVDETGAQIERLVSPRPSGLFKDEGWDYGVYDFDEVFGTEALENTFRSPLTRSLIMEFDGKIDPKTKVTYFGESTMSEVPSGSIFASNLSRDEIFARTSPEGFDTEVTFQDIVDSVDLKLTDKKQVVDVNTGEFENLGEEILTDFLDKKTGGAYRLHPFSKEYDQIDKEKINKTVLGADLLKLLENDPRMNVKNIPEFMKTQEFKNRKITLDDVGEEIRDQFTDESFNVRASPLTTPRYAKYQLQGTAGFEGGAKDKTYEVPVYSRLGTGQEGIGYSAKREHYGFDTLSHVRFSVYEPSRALRITDQDTGIFDALTENKNFILVEELQSDLISGGVKKFKRIPYTVENTRKIIDDDIDNFFGNNMTGELTPDKSNYLATKIIKEYADDIAKDITEFFDELDNKLKIDSPKGPDYELGVLDFTDDLADDAYHKLKKKYGKLIQKQILDRKIDSYDEVLQIKTGANKILSTILSKVQNPNEFARASARFHGGYNALSDQRAVNIMARANPNQFGSPPIKKNIEAVELNIQTLINQANDMGIDKIVFPSFDMIAAMRFKGDELKAAINNKSIKRDASGDPIYDKDNNPVLIEGNALYRNYVTDFNKALNKFKTEYPEIKIETGVELPYKPYAGLASSRFEDLRTDGVVIDISKMKEVYDLSKPKFSGGGLVREQ